MRYSTGPILSSELQESTESGQSSQYVQYFTKGEFQPAATQPAHAQHQDSHNSQGPTIHEPKPVVPDSTKGITEASEEQPPSTVTPIQLAQDLKKTVAAQDERRPSLAMQQSWDAQKYTIFAISYSSTSC